MVRIRANADNVETAPKFHKRKISVIFPQLGNSLADKSPIKTIFMQ